MNCKLGDMAIIIAGDRTTGRICEVIATCPRGVDFTLPDGFHHEAVQWEWIVRFQNPIAVDTTTGRQRLTLWAPVPDRVLRPVSGLPVEDEVIEDLKEPA